ncbi:MAG: UDP-N-acetylmuramate dehydrogenase [Candidatus Sungbacteria bacterium]|nr:UDP-N-acetylmuramate dehydrogenase [Candidatus Sungbacteria bacterium]
MLSVREQVPLAPFSFLRIGGTAQFFAEISNAGEAEEARQFARKQGVEVIVMGEGSNTVFGDGVIGRLFLQIGNHGIRIASEDEGSALITIAGGENWDEAVAWAVERNFTGIEALSGIPGSAGAAPVQNIGAYGQELKDTLLELGAYDFTAGKLVTLTDRECDFQYRDSIFRREENRNRFLILRITLRLSKSNPHIPNYPDVKTYFGEKGIERPTLSEIRNAVLEIRASKLPNPKEFPNVGSFFKNPIVTEDTAERLLREFPDMPQYRISSGVKISAAWLIETLGLKGKTFGAIGIYEKHALVFVNRGGATFRELREAASLVQERVFSRFSIQLDPEPLFVE